MNETKIQLPEGFLLGAAISAHQTEGNNKNSDWWFYEEQGRVPKSGLACDHYNRYKEDFNIAKEIGLDSMRISVEWARIEPIEGSFDLAEVKHYSDVLKSLRELGLTNFVTLHHFSLPLWASKKGGFYNKEIVKAFVNYSGFIIQELGDLIDFCCTINEPEVHSLLSYTTGVHPPFKKNFLLQVKVVNNLILAHNLAFKEIKRVSPNLPVGIVKNNVYYEPHNKNSSLDKFLCRTLSYIGNDYIMDRVAENSDFIGLNYYFTHTLTFDISKGFKYTNENYPKSDMGWRTFPEGIYHLLLGLKKYKKPIYITENGIANAHDDMRKRFIYEHLSWAMKAVNEGANLKGYLYWSLMDNYEWYNGYGPRFGLVEMNYETQERRIRESASIFKELRA